MVLNPIIPVVGLPGLVAVVHVGKVIDPVNTGDAVKATVPVAAGKVIVLEPATDGACSVMVPETSPPMTIELKLIFLYAV